MNDEDRQLLKPYIPRLVGTAVSAEIEAQRAYLAADWCTRTALPKLFRRNGWVEEAERLEQLQAVINSETAQAATEALRNARDVAYRFRSEQRTKVEAKLRESLWAAGAAGAAGDAGAAGAAWAAWDAWAAWAAGAAWDDSLIHKLTSEIKELVARTPAAKRYDAVYSHVYATMRPRYDEHFKELRAEVIASGFDLLDRMLAVQGAA